MSKVDTAMPPWKDITSISSSQVFLSVSQSLPCHRSIPDTKASSFLQGRTGPSMASVCFYPSLLPSNKLYFCLSRFVLEEQVCKAQNLSPVIALLAVLCSIFFFSFALFQGRSRVKDVCIFRKILPQNPTIEGQLLSPKSILKSGKLTMTKSLIPLQIFLFNILISIPNPPALNIHKKFPRPPPHILKFPNNT